MGITYRKKRAGSKCWHQIIVIKDFKFGYSDYMVDMFLEYCSATIISEISSEASFFSAYDSYGDQARTRRSEWSCQKIQGCHGHASAERPPCIFKPEALASDFHALRLLSAIRSRLHEQNGLHQIRANFRALRRSRRGFCHCPKSLKRLGLR